MKNYNNFGEFCVELANLKGDGCIEDAAIIEEGLSLLKKEFFPYCYKKANENYHDAEDLCQTCLMKVFMCLYKFKDLYLSGGPEECMKYAYGIAGFTNKDLWRKLKIFIPYPEGDSVHKGVKGIWVYRESTFSDFTTSNEDGEECGIDDVKAFYPNSEYENPIGESVEEKDAIITSYHTIIHKAFNCKQVTGKNNKPASIQLYIRVLYVLSVINNYAQGDLDIEKKNYTTSSFNKYSLEDIIGKSYSEVREYLKNAILENLSFDTPDWNYIFEGFDKDVCKKKLNDKPFHIASATTANESYARLNSKLPDMIYDFLQNENNSSRNL